MATSTTYRKKDSESSVAELAKLFDKTPPHAYEAECALLGAMILDGQVIGDVVQVLKGSDDFYRPAHAAVYQVLVTLFEANQPIDMVHLKQALDDRNELEQVGGLEYLLTLAESVPSATTAPHYATIVRDKAILRRLIESTGEVLHRAYTSSEPVSELLDIAEREIFKLAERNNDSEATEIKLLLQEVYDKLEAHDGSSLVGVATGFYELDEMTAGLQKGEMIILAARPSMGKTALALNIAENIAANDKVPVAVFSLEMSKQALAERLMSSRSGVDSQRIRRRMLTANDFNRLYETSAELSQAPLYIDDTPGLQLLALRAKARRLAARHDIRAIVIDYLQLMSAPGSESRQQEVSVMSRSVKELARELDIPIVCLSQLNRAAENREGHRPRMSDLRESGSIEQDADVIMMLHREEYYHNEPEWAQEHPDQVGVAELIIAKQRNGPTGTVRLQFNGQTTRFNNLAQGQGEYSGEY